MKTNPAYHPGLRAPLAAGAAAFAFGIWLEHHVQRPATAWVLSTVAFVICAAVAAGAGNLRLAQVSSALALVCAGSVTCLDAAVPRAVSLPAEFLYGERVEIEGHVVSDGAVLPGGLRERFDLETEKIRLGGRAFLQPVGVRLTGFTKDGAAEDAIVPAALPRLVYGDRVRCVARLRAPRNFRNPGAFDYEGYLRGLGITALASVNVDEVRLLPGRSGSKLGFWRSRIRRSILERMAGPVARLWEPADAALFAAMVVGNDSLVARDIREEFQATGAYHLLVVSGMNVALLALAIFWTARRLRLPEWPAALVTVVLAMFYAYIAGMGVPIQRAVLMLAVFMGARLLYRERAPLNAAGLAALAVLAASPEALFEAGFQLTFLALLAIAGISLPLLERTSAPARRALQHFDSTAYDLVLDPRLAQFRLDLRLVAGRLARFTGAALARRLVAGLTGLLLACFELILVSAITQAALVWPMRAYFHRAAVAGLAANALALPLAGAMLNSAVAAIALSYLSLPLARAAAWIAAAALHWTLACLGLLAHMPMARLRVPDAGLALSLIAALGIAGALFAARRRRAAAWAGACLLFISAAVTAFAPGPARIFSGRLEITAIDVGQGDALLVISPQGRAMLMDGGGAIGPARGEFDFGEDVVSPYLWSRGLEKLDVVALSHAHGDHIGGLARVLENFRPRELWVGINPETAELDHLYGVAAANGVSIRRYASGDAFAWAGVDVRVLAPPRDWRPKTRPMNNDSLALVVSFGQTRALLAGDLEKKMEEFICAESPRADLLKVAHHGSATSTTPDLLAAVRPRFAVISVGWRNSFGHPRPEVLQRLQDARVATYRTDMMGLVAFLLDGHKVEAKPGGF